MKYSELEAAAEKRISSVPMFFAFSNEQFAEGLKKLGVDDPKELVSIIGGGYIKKTDKHLLEEAYEENMKERKEFLADPKQLHEAFLYELGNHEHCITGNDVEVWCAVGASVKDSTPEQRKIFVEAKEEYYASVVY